ncbi:MAG: metal-dependent hydrolase [Aureispira sp.]|nr:metal-dependent hydrolase [Aureispira sp.]
MDSISQAALGAAIGEVMLGKKLGNKAAFLGAIVATIPDLDVMLVPFYNNLERISIHRGYSHSIVFTIIAALGITFVLKRMQRLEGVSFQRIYCFSWLTLITHLLLDTFTSYGTQLFLPFSNYRASFDSINIVDPLYTLPLLVGLFLSLYWFKNTPNRSKYTTWGLILSTAYLLGTLVVKESVGLQIKQNLSAQSISYESFRTIPVAIGSVNWYGVAKSKDSLYLGKYSNWERNKVNFEAFPINDTLLMGLDKELVSTLKWFAKEQYVVAKTGNKVRFYNLQSDMQGVQEVGNEKMPTACYFEITIKEESVYELKTAKHLKKGTN